MLFAPIPNLHKAMYIYVVFGEQSAFRLYSDMTTTKQQANVQPTKRQLLQMDSKNQIYKIHVPSVFLAFISVRSCPQFFLILQTTHLFHITWF